MRMSGRSAAYNSVHIFNLVAGRAGAANALKTGITDIAQLLGAKYVGTEVNNMQYVYIFLHYYEDLL